MPSESAFRTEAATPQSLNERIRRETVANVYATLASGGDAIDTRLRELDEEWDTERTLETMAATFVLSGLALAATERVALKAARGDFASARDATELGSARALLASATQ